MSDERVTLDDIDLAVHPALSSALRAQEWRRVPPVLRGPAVILRELTSADAAPLLTLLSRNEAGRFVPAAADPAAFERFIVWAREKRAEGELLCLGLVPAGLAYPVGLFEVRQLEAGFGVAEWSFAVASQYWGDGLFYAAAPLVIDFTFDVLGARRLEARAPARSARASGALRKLGAVREALLRQSLERDGERTDEVLWAILADEWRALRPASWLTVH